MTAAQILQIRAIHFYWGVVMQLLPTDPVARVRVAARFWRRVDVPTAAGTVKCWRWRGNRCFGVDADTNVTAARMAYVLTFGETDGPVRRLCRTPTCVRPDHNTTAPATAARVRALRGRGLSQRQVAERLGVTQACVSRLERREEAAA